MQKSPKPWTNEEDKLIDELYYEISNEELAKKLGRTVGSVKMRASTLFVTEKIVYALYKGDELIDEGTAEELADTLGITTRSVYVYATKSRVEKAKKSGKQRYAIKVGGHIDD